MKKTVLILMLLTIISKILGFFRDITLSYFFGATIISDVYLISLTIPTVIFAIIGKGISTGFIPMYTHIERNDGLIKAHRFTNNLVNLIILICSIILILGMIFTGTIVKVFASGFEGESLELAIKFTRITMVGIYFTGLIYIFSPFLQMKGIFVLPALIGLPSNLIMIGSFFLSSKTNIYILAIGSLIGIGSQFLLICIFCYKTNFRYKPRLEIKDKYVKKMFYLALPAIIGSSIAQINILVDRTLASRIVDGGISALNYANTLNLFVLGIVVASIVTVLFPRIAKFAEVNNYEQMKKMLSSSISVINLFVLPATAGYMFLADPITQLLYGRGSFESNALSMTSSALFFYSIGLVGFSVREIVSKAFFSLHDTKTPMMNASIEITLNIVLNIILSKLMGVSGLALATSISSVIGTILLLYKLKKKIGDFEIKTIFFSFSKIILASLTMGIVSMLTYRFFLVTINQALSLLIAIFVGGILYMGIVGFMKIAEVNWLLNEARDIAKNFIKIRKVS